MLRSGVHLFIDGVVVRRIGLILAALLLGTAGAGGAPPASAPASGPATTQAVPPRAPAPGEAERAKGLALVKSVFKDDWAKTAAADRVALARRLLAEAAATRDNPGARYVLFEQAGECAAAGGDAELAVKSMDGLARYFVVTPLEPKVRLLARTAPAVATPAGQEVLVEQCLALLPEAMREDRFDLAETLAGTAESAAVRSKKVALVDALGPRVAESRQLAAEYAVVAGALEKLKTAPEDPQENWSVGRYYCFAKGQWERGLPYLAKCSDAGIRDMAAREVAGVSDPQEQARLADAWWALAEKLTGPARTHTARHAVGWYQTAARGLEGITLAAIRQRIEAGQPGKAADTQPATRRRKASIYSSLWIPRRM